MFVILSKNCHMQSFTPCQNFILQHMVCNFIIALLHILTFVEQSAWSSFVLFAASSLHSTWLLIIDKTTDGDTWPKTTGVISQNLAQVNQRSQQRSSITFGLLQIPWFHQPCLKLTPEQKAIVAHYLLLLYETQHL